MKKIMYFSFVVVFVLSAASIGMQKQAESVPGFVDLFPHEEVTGYLMTDGMTMIVFPLGRDNFYQYYTDIVHKIGPTEVRTYELKDVEVGYSGLYLVSDPERDYGYLRYTVLYHTTGSRLLALGIYDRGYLDKNGEYVAEEKYFTKDVRTNNKNPDTEHSVLGDFYPNKIINDLEAAQAILDYQRENGPFIAGKEYSMLEILDLKDRDGYVLGKNSAGGLVTGGGVCVVVTNWMKMLTLSGAKVTEKWEHPTSQTYFENPVGAQELLAAETDATVQWPEYDLKWIQKETGWVTISAAVIPDGDKSETDYGGEDIKYDAIELITMRFTTEKPDLSTNVLKTWKKVYIDYRASGKASTEPLLSGGSRILSRQTWSEDDSWSQLLAGIVPEERVEDFSSELTSDPFLMSIVELREYVNKIDPESDILMGQYLRSTPWYSHERARLKYDPKKIKQLDEVMIFLDMYSNYYPGQKFQCYALGVLLEVMDDRYPNIGGAPVQNAADLVPEEIRTGENISSTKWGMLIRVVENIDEVNVGDIGVKYDTKAGHVFAVVDKKIVGGETVLLIAAANQKNDGKISLFEVDESNFSAIFGSPTTKMVIIEGTN